MHRGRRDRCAVVAVVEDADEHPGDQSVDRRTDKQPTREQQRGLGEDEGTRLAWAGAERRDDGEVAAPLDEVEPEC